MQMNKGNNCKFMNKYTITLEIEAELALKEIFQYYIDVANYEIADSNMSVIEAAINALEFMPNRCPISDFSPNIRKLVVPKLPYLVFYTVKNDEVIILNIFHERRDQNILSSKYQNF